MLVVLVLVLAAFVFIETPFGQNWIAKQITKKFSRELNARISFKHVSFTLLNRFNIEDLLIRDQQNDTLLYAGRLQLSITDWFLFKKRAELKYLGLQNSIIKFQRKDSVWNYKFIVDYFASPPDTDSKKSGTQFNLKQLALKNVEFMQKDAWAGEDITAVVGQLQLSAKQIDPETKTIDVNYLGLDAPFFRVYDYAGKENPLQANATTMIHSSAGMDSVLQWNQDGWAMNIRLLQINNGVFKDSRNTGLPVLPYFDGTNISFSNIDGQFRDLRLHKDTLSAKINNLSAEERSGVVVKSFTSDVSFNPKGMFFGNLDLRTDRSIVKNYFSMTYSEMGDLDDFVHKVTLQADFENSTVNSDDIAFFAPDLKPWKKNITITGRVRGTVADISGRGLIINAGNGTYLNGDLTLSGLPDIDQTFIDLKSNDTRTSYADIVRFIPAARNITNPDLAALGNIHFTGSFTGFLHDFVTFGAIHTNLGTISTDLNMKLHPGSEPVYSGNIATTGFQLGKFIHSSSVGLISFSGVVKGHGASENTVEADLQANISELEFNNYRYHGIVANGTIEKRLFNGFVSIDDSNLRASLNGLVNINGAGSKFDLVADVRTANLQPLQLNENNIYFNGKFNLNFTGNNIDNFLGLARISNATVSRDNHRLFFDSLVLSSDYRNGIRTLSFGSNEFNGNVTGDFHIQDLPNAIQLFLNKYYPSYIHAPSEVITHQNFKFNLITRNIDTLVQLLSSDLKGFNNSNIQGSLDLAQNQLQLTANVPQFVIDDQYSFNNASINANGTLTGLSVNGTVQNIALNDSISLPNTSFSINAANDLSKIKISTAANQAVTRANLNADVVTYSDGIKIDFDTSSFVLNTKTWTIDKGGELSFRNKANARGEVVLHESNQQVRLRTVPSGEGNWNDLIVDLTNVNIGDLSPYFSSRDRFEGILSGSARIDNPGEKMTAAGNFKTEFFRYNEDSIGELNLNNVSYDHRRDGNLKFQLTNPDSLHAVHAEANIYLAGDHTDNLISVDTKEYQLKFLENFLGDIFSDIQGYATGKLAIKGSLDAPDYVGKVHLHNAGVKPKFTQVFYRLKDTDVELKEHELDLGTIKLTDTLTHGTATVSGSIYHDSWKNLNFDLEAKVDGRPMTLLNTAASDNNSFYGHAVGTGSMILVGSETDMYMTIDAKSSETDSSHIIIPPERTRASELSDFLVERTHGHTPVDTQAVASNSKITFDIDLTADPHTTIEVILDEVTGDVVKGRGRGSLNIHSATGEPLTLNGNIDIEDGSYLFTFQSFFKRPFELRKGGSNYIRWNGDPNKATIHFDAQYTAEKVSFAPLASFINDPRVQTLRDDVYVIVTMSGELFKPDFSFKLEFPTSSVATSDPILPYNIQQIENNPNELNKQVTYLIVFNSFAPVSNLGNSSSSASSSAVGGFGNAINELAYNTISSLLFNELNRQFSSILSQIFKDDKLKVILSGSVYNRNLIQQSSSNFNINTANVNLTLSRALFNDRIVITAGSTLDIPFQTTFEQTTQFLPDVTTEWLINDKGTIRATFFYRENLDFEPSATNSISAKDRRLGAGLAYRLEFNRLADVFRRKRETKKENQNPIATSPGDSTLAPSSVSTKNSSQ